MVHPMHNGNSPCPLHPRSSSRLPCDAHVHRLYIYEGDLHRELLLQFFDFIHCGAPRLPRAKCSVVVVGAAQMRRANRFLGDRKCTSHRPKIAIAIAAESEAQVQLLLNEYVLCPLHCRAG